MRLKIPYRGHRFELATTRTNERAESGLTTACSLTAVRERFRLDLKRHSWAAAAEAEALDG